MKFFKHFTDAHRGKSMQLLMHKYGPADVGRYWILVEICAEKMSKERDEEYSEAHCHFEFEMTYLMRTLGFGNRHQAATYLARVADLGLCSFERDGDVVSCSMPKLLECLDRDSKRARPERDASAPKNKSKNKRKNKEYIKRDFPESEFDRLAEKYRKTFPGTTAGPKAKDRFFDQIKSPADIQDLEASMANYRVVLDGQDWRSPKTTFANFLGTESSGYYWREFINPPEAEVQGPSIDRLKVIFGEG